MGGVVSFGSVNRDCVATVDREAIQRLARRYPWMPDPGETTSVSGIPDPLRDRSWERFSGGKGANQAVAARGAGVDAGFLGAVGDDDAGTAVIDSLREWNVDVGCVETTTSPTGRAFVFVDDSGENYILVVPGANADVDEDYVERHFETLRAADYLLLQNEIPVEPMLFLMDRLADLPERPVVVFDPAPAAGAEVLVSHSCVDVVTPNESEYHALRPSIDAFDGVVIRTRGDSFVRVTGPQQFTVEPADVDAVDSTGAGDVFNGFFAAMRAADLELRRAVEIATAAASLSVREPGVREAIPSIDDVEQFES